MNYVDVECCVCKKVFKRSIRHFNNGIKYGWKVFCCKECQKIGKSRKVKTVCENCGKEFEKKLSQYNKTPHHYCSHSCAITINNIGNKRNYRGGGRYREPAFRRYGTSCAVCGYTNDNLSTLDVHHLDKNRNNNSVENLIVLCPTHHREYHLGILPRE